MEDILYKNSVSDIRIREMVNTVSNNEKHDYSQDYLTFEALEDGTFSFQTTIDYSIDNGKTWTTLSANTNTPTVNQSNKILWKGEITFPINTGYSFSSTGQFNVSGNAYSILYNEPTTENIGKVASLFARSKVVSAKNLYLGNSEQTVPLYGLANLFLNCTSLIEAPELPATILSYGCYDHMFSGCTSLTTAPELPATTLDHSCYAGMFSGCTSLITAPRILPATTLATACYGVFQYMGSYSNGMFYNCTSLTTAPILPATTLAASCYQGMFYGCTNLTYIKMMATDISANACLSGWVGNVAANGTFVKNVNATWTTTGSDGIPTGWTVETANS